MIRHNHVRTVANHKILDGYALLCQPVYLVQKRAGVYHNAVADNARLSVVQRASGDKVELVCNVVHNDGMTGVIAALIPNDHIRFVCEKIDKPPFSLVSPLCAEYCNT